MCSIYLFSISSSSVAPCVDSEVICWSPVAFVSSMPDAVNTSNAAHGQVTSRAR